MNAFDAGRHVVIQIGASRVRDLLLTLGRTNPALNCFGREDVATFLGDKNAVAAAQLIGATNGERVGFWFDDARLLAATPSSTDPIVELRLMANGVRVDPIQVDLTTVAGQLTTRLRSGLDAMLSSLNTAVFSVDLNASAQGALTAGIVLGLSAPRDDASWNAFSGDFLSRQGVTYDWALAIPASTIEALAMRMLQILLVKNHESFRTSKPDPTYIHNNFSAKWSDTRRALLVHLDVTAIKAILNTWDADASIDAVFRFVLDDDGRLDLQRLEAHQDAWGIANDDDVGPSPARTTGPLDTATDPKNIFSPAPISVALPGGGTMRATNVSNDPGGVIVSGSLSRVAPPSPPILVTDVGLVALYESPQTRCPGPHSDAVYGEKLASFRNAVQGTQLSLCEVYLDGPPDFYIASGVTVPPIPVAPSPDGRRLEGFAGKPVQSVTVRVGYRGPRDHLSAHLRTVSNDPYLGQSVEITTSSSYGTRLEVEPRHMDFVATAATGRPHYMLRDCQEVAVPEGTTDGLTSVITITNTGDAPLYACRVNSNNAHFVVDESQLLIPPGTSHELAVRYLPHTSPESTVVGQIDLHFAGVPDPVLVDLSGRIDPEPYRYRAAGELSPSDPEYVDAVANAVCLQGVRDVCRARELFEPVADPTVRRLGIVELIGMPPDAHAALVDADGAQHIVDVSSAARREITAEFKDHAAAPGAAPDPCRVTITGAASDGVRVRTAGRLLERVAVRAPDGAVEALAIAGSLVFVTGAGALRVIDWSNPAAPREVARSVAPAMARAQLASVLAGASFALQIADSARVATYEHTEKGLRLANELALHRAEGAHVALHWRGVCLAEGRELSLHVAEAKTLRRTRSIELPARIDGLSTFGSTIVATSGKAAYLVSVLPDDHLALRAICPLGHWTRGFATSLTGKSLVRADARGGLELWRLRVHAIDRRKISAPR